ncbi:MAG: tetratricopeptide repeat protein [Saprospiraceae bacterium]|nr:tetratricopeptide repeat protein [Saprospiraceae bacterium]
MSFLANIRLQSILLAVFAALLYANTLGHGWVLDDTAVISQNRWVQNGLSGIPKLFSDDSYSGFLPEGASQNLLTGGRYRPLSLAFFALLVQVFGTNPLVFHLFSVLLYAAGAVLLYRFLLRAFQPAETQPATTLIAWATTLLFVAHPVHTEVVANVKSCDEQLALLAGIGALYSVFRAYDGRSWIWGAGAALLFLLACLAKENAASLLLLAPAALWVFRRTPAETTPEVAQNDKLRSLILLVPAFIGYVVLRGTALDWDFTSQNMNDPLNNPFLKSNTLQWVPFSGTEHVATIFYTLLQYARLLVWPDPLTHDYYPFQIAPQSLNQPSVLASIVLYLVLALSIVWTLWRRQAVAFGLLLYVLPLLIVANIVVPVGTFMAERFLFLPSVGFCLLLALTLSGLAQRFGRSPVLVLTTTAVLAGLWAGLTVLRNPAWASDKKLFATDIATSPNSAKLQNNHGTVLLTEAISMTDTAARRQALTEAETHLKTAIDLHPTYFDAYLAYGACAFYLNKYDMSVAAYRGATRLNPEDVKAQTGLLYALRYGGDFFGRQRQPEQAIQYFSQAWEIMPDTAIATHLAQQLELQQQPAQAAEWLEKAVSLAPNEPRLLEALSRAYTAAGDRAKAAEVLARAKSFTTFSPAGTGNQ